MSFWEQVAIDLARFFFGTLAVYRIARFIALDEGPFGIMERFRMAVGKKAGQSKQFGLWWTLAELITCPICNSLWLSLIAMLILFRAENQWFLLWIAMAGAVDFLHAKSER